MLGELVPMAKPRSASVRNSVEILLEARQVVGQRPVDVERPEIVDAPRADAGTDVEARVRPLVAVVKVGGARRGEDEVEALAGLVERAEAGVEPEREALGRGLLEVVERGPGVAEVARSGRWIVEVVVRVGDQALGERGGEDAAGVLGLRGEDRELGNSGCGRHGQGGESGALHRPLTRRGAARER